MLCAAPPAPPPHCIRHRRYLNTIAKVQPLSSVRRQAVCVCVCGDERNAFRSLSLQRLLGMVETSIGDSFDAFCSCRRRQNCRRLVMRQAGPSNLRCFATKQGCRVGVGVRTTADVEALADRVHGPVVLLRLELGEPVLLSPLLPHVIGSSQRGTPAATEGPSIIISASAQHRHQTPPPPPIPTDGGSSPSLTNSEVRKCSFYHVSRLRLDPLFTKARRKSHGR